jgi:hypothetical protein
MILSDFLKRCKKLVDENPDVLNMEMLSVDGSSGMINEIGNPCIKEISDFEGSEEEIEYMLPNDYPFDSFVKVYVGN